MCLVKTVVGIGNEVTQCRPSITSKQGHVWLEEVENASHKYAVMRLKEEIGQNKFKNKISLKNKIQKIT